MTWVQKCLDNEEIFPSKVADVSRGLPLVTPGSRPACLPQLGVPFPKGFMSEAKKILKRLFRVYAHIYHSHFEKASLVGWLVQSGARPFTPFTVAPGHGA